MSVRTNAKGPGLHVAKMQKELGDLKAAAIAANQTNSLSTETAVATPPTPAFDDLSAVEKSAASLGVHPESW